MVVLTAPNRERTIPSGYKSLFLAGGITNCPDWQKEVIEKLKGYKVVIFNPRRDNFPIGDPAAAEEQIKWEFEHLQDANMVLFWFSRGSDNPIVLFEYGRHGFTATRASFVGVDPEYSRRNDVIIQTKLAKRYLFVHSSLDDLIQAVITRLTPLPKFGPGQQVVEVCRFRSGNQGQLDQEGELLLDVRERRMELSTFRMCCSDFLVYNNVLVAGFLNRTFLMAYEKEGKMASSMGGDKLRIHLASYDPQWCRKCGAEVTPPGPTPGPVCKSCCITCH
jgi:hypothetical protein